MEKREVIISSDFKIETERLILRPWTLDDADRMFELNADPEVVKYTGNDAFKDKQEVIHLISGYEQYTKYNMRRWTVELKHNKEYLGWCGLKFIRADEIDLGFRFFRKHWGKGYATESAMAALHHGFETLALNKIFGRAVKENVRSLHVLKKLGMTYEKYFESHGYLCEQYIMTKETWKQMTK